MPDSPDPLVVLLAEAMEKAALSLALDPDTPFFSTDKPYFNRVYAVTDRSSGVKLVARVARQNLVASYDSKITNDYLQLGFFEQSCRYRLRSHKEQAIFHNHCTTLGLKVPQVLFASDLGSIVEFLPGRTVSVALMESSAPGIVRHYLDSVAAAHRCGVAFGDRHCSNAILDPKNDIWHIDFDICIEGRAVFDFEISEALFRTLHLSTHSPTAVSEAAEFLIESGTLYERTQIIRFLSYYCAYKGQYPSGKYSKAVPMVRALLHELSLMRD